jgi:hypothetical protein
MANPIVSLDIGGKTFRVLRETIMKYPQSTLAQVISGKDTHNLIKVDNNFFFDRNPHYFEVVLDFLRNGKLIKPDKLSDGLLNEELKFWKIKADQVLPAGAKEPEPVLIKQVEPAKEQIEATLLLPMENVEPTLLMPADFSSTQEYAPTLLMDQEFESTLLMTELPTTQEVAEEAAPLKSSYVPIDQDDLLGKLMNRQPEPAREERKLPWGTKAAPGKKAAESPKKRRKITKDSESEANDTESYDSSEDREIGDTKAKTLPKRAAASRGRKVTLPSAAELKASVKELANLQARSADKPAQELPKKRQAEEARPQQTQAPPVQPSMPQAPPAQSSKVQAPPVQAPSIQAHLVQAPPVQRRVFIYGFEGTKKTQLGTKVRKLGGVVVKSLTDNPTHVIMPDFKKDLAEMRAQSLEFASEDWVDSSIDQKAWMSTSAFNPLP